MQGTVRLLLLVIICLRCGTASHSSSSATNEDTAAASSQESQRTAQYDEQFAFVMLQLSAGAYAVSPKECIQRALPAPMNYQLAMEGSEKCDDLDNLCSFYAVVSEAGRQIVVVFRGTRNKFQLLEEGVESQQPGNDFFGIGKVNEYFMNGLNVLWKYVEKVLDNPKYRGSSVAFTGHSLGGALASLAAIRSVMEGMVSGAQIRLYTFGQPRVGCAAFAFKHDELIPDSFRIVNKIDIAPHLPPCSNNLINQMSKPCDAKHAGIAYHHGTEVWYPDGMPGRFRICTGLPRNEDFTCSDKITFSVFMYIQSFDDHRHYFGHKVPAFGKLGCAPNQHAREEALPNDAVTANDVDDTASGCGSFFGNLVKGAEKVGKLLFG